MTQYHLFFSTWRQQKSDKKLTRETFLACEQICLVLRDLATYLIQENGFRFVFLGQISSDPVEKRLGLYRQMSGSNYFISQKQIEESERKLKILSIIKNGDSENLEKCSMDGNSENHEVSSIQDNISL